MKKIISTTIIVLFISVMLVGCVGTSESEEKKQLTLKDYMKISDIKKSKKGEYLTYYYQTSDYISIYYADSWHKNVISLKKFFFSKEKYELEKQARSGYRYKDDEMSIFVKEYQTVENLNDYWDEIVNSELYTIVQ